MVRRVLLEDEIAEAVFGLVKELRGKACKVDASKAVNAVLFLFFEKYVKSELRSLERQFFDRKAYLLNLAKNGSPEEIDESLKEYMSIARTLKKKQKPTKAKNGEAESS